MNTSAGPMAVRDGFNYGRHRTDQKKRQDRSTKWEVVGTNRRRSSCVRNRCRNERNEESECRRSSPRAALPGQLQ